MHVHEHKHVHEHGYKHRHHTRRPHLHEHGDGLALVVLDQIEATDGNHLVTLHHHRHTHILLLRRAYLAQCVDNRRPLVFETTLEFAQTKKARHERLAPLGCGSSHTPRLSWCGGAGVAGVAGGPWQVGVVGS